MLIDFEKIRFKNISSYGNNITEFIFRKGLNLISAPNGSGKSSILEALTFVLYGKPYRDIKIDQLINDTNGSKLWVEVFFSKGQDKYHIIRGLKPGIFEIKINGQSIDILPNKNSNQEEIDKIIGLNYHLFKQIIALSTLNNKPFLALPLPEKRNVTESVFNIKIFSKMLKKLKKNRTALETGVEINDRELALMKENLTGLANQIKSLRKAKDDFEVEKQKDIDQILFDIREAINQIEWFKEEIAANDPCNIKPDLETLQALESDLNGEMQDLVSKKIKLSRDKDDLRKNIEREYADNKIRTFELLKIKLDAEMKEVDANPLTDKRYVIKNTEEVLKRNKKITANENELERIRAEISRLANGEGVCSHCLQTVPDEHREKEIESRKEREKVLMDKTKTLKDEVDKIVLEITSKAKTEFSDYSKFYAESCKDMERKRSEIKEECENEIAAKAEKLTEDIEAVTKKIKKLGEDIEAKSNQQKDILRKHTYFKVIIEKQKDLEERVKSYHMQIDKIKSKTFTIDIDSMVADFEKRKGNYQDLMTKNKAMKKKLNVTEVIKDILDEEGIKKYFFSRLIPKLNTSINEYLEVFELPLNFEFNETFEETIKEFGDKEKSYYQFSNGEQYRLNLAITLSFMDLNRLINSFECNILFFDELLDNAVDSSGMELVLEKLHGLAEANGTAIYIISHKEIENSMYIDHLIRVKKVNGFSKIL